jgi:hypothetical protein
MLRCFDASVRHTVRYLASSVPRFFDVSIASTLASMIEARSVLGRFEPRYLAPMLASICGHFDNRLLASILRRLGTFGA